MLTQLVHPTRGTVGNVQKQKLPELTYGTDLRFPARRLSIGMLVRCRIKRALQRWYALCTTWRSTSATADMPGSALCSLREAAS